MVPATHTSRSPRRVAGLLMAAGAVLGPACGAHADERTANGAPQGPSGSSPAAVSQVTRSAVHGIQAVRAGQVAAVPASEAPASGAPVGGPPAAPSPTAPPAGPGPSGAPSKPPAQPPPAGPSATPPAHVSPVPLVIPPGNGPLAPPSRSGGPSPSESASRTAGASVRPSGDNSPLAGRQAGEGRTRPGRSLSPLEIARSEAALERDEPVADTDMDSETGTDAGREPAVTPPPGAFPEPGRTARQALNSPSVRQVQQVSLGAGIILVGLGLGFLGFRMRRTN